MDRSDPAPPRETLLLGVDTCGSTGSVAVARLSGQKLEGKLEILAQKELAGRSYSATLVAAVGELLAQAQASIAQLGAIVAVNGPGSFTGVRVGLSAVKGLAEGARIPVIAISRLEVLAAASGVSAAALDAHRSEIFLRAGSRELLAGAGELAQLEPEAPARVAICDEAAAALLHAAWPAAELVRVAAPTAADALALSAERAKSGAIADLALTDLALLDGHYLRRSDAEIFGEPRSREADSQAQKS